MQWHWWKPMTFPKVFKSNGSFLKKGFTLLCSIALCFIRMLFKRWHCSSSLVSLYRTMNSVHWNCHSCELHMKHVRKIKDTAFQTDQVSAGLNNEKWLYNEITVNRYNQTLMMCIIVFLDFCLSHWLLNPSLIEFRIAKVEGELKYLGWLSAISKDHCIFKCILD